MTYYLNIFKGSYARQSNIGVDIMVSDGDCDVM